MVTAVALDNLCSVIRTQQLHIQILAFRNSPVQGADGTNAPLRLRLRWGFAGGCLRATRRRTTRATPAQRTDVAHPSCGDNPQSACSMPLPQSWLVNKLIPCPFTTPNP